MSLKKPKVGDFPLSLPQLLVCSCLYGSGCGIPLWESNCHTIKHLFLGKPESGHICDRHEMLCYLGKVFQLKPGRLLPGVREERSTEFWHNADSCSLFRTCACCQVFHLARCETLGWWNGYGKIGGVCQEYSSRRLGLGLLWVLIIAFWSSWDLRTIWT